MTTLEGCKTNIQDAIRGNLSFVKDALQNLSFADDKKNALQDESHNELKTGYTPGQ